MSTWYNQIREKTHYIVEEIKRHPFIMELVDGSLPVEIFLFYIQQDAHYLAEYKKTLASIGVKCRETDETQFFLNAATGILEVEQALHQNFLSGHAINKELSVSCELYVSYLSRVIHTKSLEEGLAAILPCFTIYKEIGEHIQRVQTNKESNRYQSWIDTYGGEAFALSVNTAVEIVNRYAHYASPDVLEAMAMAFEKSSKLEWMFWDSAYRQEQWKI